MINLIKNFNGHSINCCGVKMGNDWNISIFGGHISHIGAVAIGIPRPSLEDKNKISSSVSLITVTGHKEDVIVQKCAKELSSKINSTVVVCCGIHIDNITFDEIMALGNIVDEIIHELVLEINKNATL